MIFTLVWDETLHMDWLMLPISLSLFFLSFDLRKKDRKECWLQLSTIAGTSYCFENCEIKGIWHAYNPFTTT